MNWEYADLSDLVTVICDEQAMVARRGIRISCAAEPGIFIDMDVFLISRVVQNLLDNAFKFGVDGGWIHVALPAHGCRGRADRAGQRHRYLTGKSG